MSVKNARAPASNFGEAIIRAICCLSSAGGVHRAAASRREQFGDPAPSPTARTTGAWPWYRHRADIAFGFGRIRLGRFDSEQKVRRDQQARQREFQSCVEIPVLARAQPTPFSSGSPTSDSSQRTAKQQLAILLDELPRTCIIGLVGSAGLQPTMASRCFSLSAWSEIELASAKYCSKPEEVSDSIGAAEREQSLLAPFRLETRFDLDRGPNTSAIVCRY